MWMANQGDRSQVDRSQHEREVILEALLSNFASPTGGF